VVNLNLISGEYNIILITPQMIHTITISPKCCQSNWACDPPLPPNIVINPIEHKLFSGDKFTVSAPAGVDAPTISDEMITISNSSARAMTIPAVLILDGNKTYGRSMRVKTHLPGRLLYKCIPHNSTLPSFLVPYEAREASFSKKRSNLYVTIKYASWGDVHPHAMLCAVFGPTTDDVAWRDYFMCYNSLDISMKSFNREVSIRAKTTDTDTIAARVLEKAVLEDRRGRHVFSIDPAGCTDVDDAVGVHYCSNDAIGDRVVVSVYIANVPLCLDALELWPYVTERASTIYLPSKKLPMLPSQLSDNLCSLIKNVPRAAFTMDVVIVDNNRIESITYVNSIISVSDNYVYEEARLKSDAAYDSLLNICRTLNNSKAARYMPSITDSHDVVAYLMSLMNNKCAIELSRCKAGIFRTATRGDGGEIFPSVGQNDPAAQLPIQTQKFLNHWNSHCCAEYSTINIGHILMQLNEYTHITSPIRRIVDLINMQVLQQLLKLHSFSPQATNFCAHIINTLSNVNNQMKAARKLQTNMELLTLYRTTALLTTKTYGGLCFNKRLCERSGKNIYDVYLDEIRIVMKYKCHDNIINMTNHNFKLVLFEHEATFTRKIKLFLYTG
jgi:hypothetical protein